MENKMLEPRPYQIECLEVVEEARNRGVDRQLIVLPTGCGKTVIFALLAKQLNLKTLVIAHTEELISQAVNKLSMIWPESTIGIVKAESDQLEAQVVVASVQTASRDNRLQRLKEQSFGLMIIDEAHHSTTDSYTKVIKSLGFFEKDPDKLLVGVTATPRRADGIGLNSIFEHLVFERSISTMVRAGYLSKLVGRMVVTEVDLRSVSVKNGDFITTELAKAVNTPSRNQLIVDSYLQCAISRNRALVFCADVQHAEVLAQAFKRSGIQAASIYGDMNREERRKVLEDFSKGTYRVLTNCQLLTEGFDEPSIDCVILARPTKSIGLYTQMIGRGTRIHPMKRDCLILDFCDNTARHDLCNYKNTLDGVVTPLFNDSKENKDEATSESENKEIFKREASKAVSILRKIEEVDFFGHTDFAWTSVGDSWHLRLAEDRDVWARSVEGGYLVTARNEGEMFSLSKRPLPLDYALGISEDWARKQTTRGAWARKDASWRSHPASEKQIDLLQKYKIPFKKGISRGEASILLDSKFNEPATAKQIFWLNAHGIQVDGHLTKNQAKSLIGERMVANGR